MHLIFARAKMSNSLRNLKKKQKDENKALYAALPPQGVKAPGAGTVRELPFAEGDSVAEGVLLVGFDAAE